MIDHKNSQEDVEEAGELVFRQNKQTNEPITHHTKFDYYDDYDHDHEHTHEHDHHDHYHQQHDDIIH